MIAMKFGGTSVEDAKAINRLAEIVKGRSGHKPVVVVSAMAKVTDALVAMSNAAANGALSDALKQLRQLRQRHFKVLDDLVSGKRETAVGSIRVGSEKGPHGHAVGATFLLGRRLYAAASRYSIAKGVASGTIRSNQAPSPHRNCVPSGRVR